AGVHDRLDLRQPHQVAHRHDPDQLVALDHRQVPVAAVVEGGERLLHRHVGGDRVGVGGHQLGDLEVGRRRPAGDAAQDVALGEDADGAVAVDDDHGTDPAVVHAAGRGGDGLVGQGRHHRRAHDLGDRADDVCGAHTPQATAVAASAVTTPTMGAVDHVRWLRRPAL